MRDAMILSIWLLTTLILSVLGNWSIGFAAALVIVPVFKIAAKRAIFFGFLIGFVSWISTAYYLDHSNSGLLSSMVGQLLQVKSSIWLLLITGLLGAIGVSLSGWLAASLFQTRKI
jgi:hypothetical protein